MATVDIKYEKRRDAHDVWAVLGGLPALSACLPPGQVKLPYWQAMLMTVFPLPRDQVRADGSTDSGTTILWSAESVAHGERFVSRTAAGPEEKR